MRIPSSSHNSSVILLPAEPGCGCRSKFTPRTLTISFDTQMSMESPSSTLLVGGPSILAVTSARDDSIYSMSGRV